MAAPTSSLELDEHNAEELYLLEPDPGAPAEQIFEKRWALRAKAKMLC